MSTHEKNQQQTGGPLDSVSGAPALETRDAGDGVVLGPQERVPERPELSPELERILQISWKKNEKAYRYLGR